MKLIEIKAYECPKHTGWVMQLEIVGGPDPTRRYYCGPCNLWWVSHYRGDTWTEPEIDNQLDKNPQNKD